MKVKVNFIIAIFCFSTIILLNSCTPDQTFNSDLPEKALNISKQLKNQFPEQASIGLSYAQSLMKLGRYIEAVQFLDSYNLLPFEGATIGRDIYHEACLRVALKAMRSSELEKAISWANKAREWPKNLGVAKPYDVDERLDNHIIARAYELSGKSEKADAYYQKVENHQNTKFANESSKLILQLFALDSSKEISISKKLLSEMLLKNNKSVYLQWVKAHYDNNIDKADIITKEILTSSNEVLPYDITYKDNEFQLIVDYVSELGNKD